MRQIINVKEHITFPGSMLMGTSTPNNLHAIAGPCPGPVCMTPCNSTGKVSMHMRKTARPCSIRINCVLPLRISVVHQPAFYEFLPSALWMHAEQAPRDSLESNVTAIDEALPIIQGLVKLSAATSRPDPQPTAVSLTFPNRYLIRRTIAALWPRLPLPLMAWSLDHSLQI